LAKGVAFVVERMDAISEAELAVASVESDFISED
jgi:hypothetical protein